MPTLRSCLFKLSHMHTALVLHQALAGTPTSAKPASLESGFTTCAQLTTTTTNHSAK